MYPQAMKFFQRALKKEILCFGPDHDHVEGTYYYIGDLHKIQGEYRKSDKI
jgi:hypothetical protein